MFSWNGYSQDFILTYCCPSNTEYFFKAFCTAGSLKMVLDLCQINAVLCHSHKQLPGTKVLLQKVGDEEWWILDVYGVTCHLLRTEQFWHWASQLRDEMWERFQKDRSCFSCQKMSEADSSNCTPWRETIFGFTWIHPSSSPTIHCFLHLRSPRIKLVVRIPCDGRHVGDTSESQKTEARVAYLQRSSKIQFPLPCSKQIKIYQN